MRLICFTRGIGISNHLFLRSAAISPPREAVSSPEKGQPFGTKSRESLSSMVAGRQVTVAWQKKDRYGRVLGVVFAENRDVVLKPALN